jgi:hypothetical protein
LSLSFWKSLETCNNKNRRGFDEQKKSSIIYSLVPMSSKTRWGVNKQRTKNNKTMRNINKQMSKNNKTKKNLDDQRSKNILGNVNMDTNYLLDLLPSLLTSSLGIKSQVV